MRSFETTRLGIWVFETSHDLMRGTKKWMKGIDADGS